MPLMTYDDLLTTANDLALELNNVSHLLDYWIIGKTAHLKLNS